MLSILFRRLVPGVLLAAVAVLLSACKPAEPQANVLLITIDTLRPDALGMVDPQRETPAIDELARSGRFFSAAVSSVPLTLPSHASILSGLLPVHHGVRDNGQTVPADIPLLQEVLHRQGYRTGAFVSGFPLQAMFGLDRGFDRYDDDMRDGEQGWVERRAGDTVAATNAWLQAQGADRPWFAWAHFYDPHDPYEPPREFWQPGPRGRYDGEVTYSDYWIGKLLEVAHQVSADRPLLIVLTADHGEALGEHQELTHGFFVYDSTMRVPLIFSWPGRIVPGSGSEPVQLIDVAPTILELLDVPAAGASDGRGMASGLLGGELALHPALMETWLPWTYYGWAPLAAWLDRQWKLVDAPEAELYDVHADPAETHNLAADQAAVADRLGMAMDALTKATQRVADTSQDDAAMQRLRSLGYVGVGAPVEAPPAGLADPKQRIDMRNTLQQGESLLRAGRFAEAQQVFAGVIESDPDNRFANLRSGIALLRLGRTEEASQVLAHAVVIEPHRAEARFAYGDALMREARFAEAAEQWAVLAELQPRRPEAWFNLASALERSGEPERARGAMVEYERLSTEQARRGQKADAQP
jgi:arylsulfatase A-like enzyme/Tfp pilus assembly protein PilF